MNLAEKVEQLIKKGYAVLGTHRPNPPHVVNFPTLNKKEFSAWQTQCLNFLESSLSSNSPYVKKFQEEVISAKKPMVETGIGILESIKEDIEVGDITSCVQSHSPLTLIKNICDRFHLIERQLQSRHDKRATISIHDEYDVQDLLHALLRLNFDDIRPEEWTPSYAGRTSRMDFFLKKERIVIEVKKTREGLNASELGSQLIEDIARYQAHPDCDTLVCFVYDPEGRIANPRGIENDLRRTEDDLSIEIWIKP